MTTLIEKITKESNSLSLYKYNVTKEKLMAEAKKQTRNINAGLKINEEDDNFLRMIAELSGESKYKASGMAYKMMQIGIASTKKAMAENTDERDITNIIRAREDISSLMKMAEVLKKHGLSLHVKEIKEDE